MDMVDAKVWWNILVKFMVLLGACFNYEDSDIFRIPNTENRLIRSVCLLGLLWARSMIGSLP